MQTGLSSFYTKLFLYKANLVTFNMSDKFDFERNQSSMTRVEGPHNIYGIKFIMSFRWSHMIGQDNLIDFMSSYLPLS